MDELLQEIIGFVSNQKFLRPEAEYKRTDVYIVHSIKEAEKYFIFNYSDDETCFNDLKEAEIGKFIQKQYESNKNSDYKKKKEILYQIDQLIRNNLDDSMLDFYSDIFVDMEYYFWSKYFSLNSFFIRFFEEFYKNGCIPCGWKGVFPKGQWVIFHPPVQKK